MDEANQLHPTIKFTAEWSDSSVTFLDTKVNLEGGAINYGPLCETNQHSSVPSPQKLPSSSLPKANWLWPSSKNVPNLHTEDYQRHDRNLASHLVNQGYNKKVVDAQIERATTTERQELLKLKNTKQSGHLPLVVTYHLKTSTPKTNTQSTFINNTHLGKNEEHSITIPYSSIPLTT